MLLVIDNYDSFTYNLVQYLGELGAEMVVKRNDAVTLDEIADLNPGRIVISPGPGRPEAAGITVEVIKRFGERIPTLGVCLGHQAIGLAFGATVNRAPVPVHGKTSVVEHDGRGVFSGLSAPFVASRYHSLIIDEHHLPDVLEVSARVQGDGLIMAVRHRQWPVTGVQFHPESILTGEGRHILRNFLQGRADGAA
jgi:anthranilate synthase/aminodeoxychorismate synthase-like glutamine amidotransferase